MGVHRVIEGVISWAMGGVDRGDTEGNTGGYSWAIL